MIQRVLAALLVLLLCAPAHAQQPCDNCGRIESIKTLTTQEAWTPLGATTTSSAPTDQPGRVTSSYNFTTGNMVVLGAAGGAGYAKRPNAYQRPRWEIKVRMDGGSVRTVVSDYEPALHEGDRVRVYGKQLELVPA